MIHWVLLSSLTSAFCLSHTTPLTGGGSMLDCHFLLPPAAITGFVKNLTNKSSDWEKGEGFCEVAKQPQDTT